MTSRGRRATRASSSSAPELWRAHAGGMMAGTWRECPAHHQSAPRVVRRAGNRPERSPGPPAIACDHRQRARSPDVTRTASRAGAEFLAKPISPTQLTAAIESGPTAARGECD